jgi:hypothetical protein
MPFQQSRRIVRRGVLTLAGVVLVASGYFGSILGLELAYGAGCVPYWFWDWPATAVYYAPLKAVARSSPTAAETIHSAMEYSQETGRRVSQ